VIDDCLGFLVDRIDVSFLNLWNHRLLGRELGHLVSVSDELVTVFDDWVAASYEVSNQLLQGVVVRLKLLQRAEADIVVLSKLGTVAQAANQHRYISAHRFFD
jgi:hypothetical protein